MGGNCTVFEWTIENFSCWNYEIHGNKIPFPRFYPFSASPEIMLLEFFPKGFSGEEKYLVVNICNPFVLGACELSFIGSDGSLIYTKSKNLKEKCFETFMGPTFENVMTEIGKHEAAHADSLTLRFRIDTLIRIPQILTTVIDVFSVSLKMNCEIYRHNVYSPGCISQIQFPIDDGKSENFFIFILKKDSTPEDVNVCLDLNTNCESTKILAQISISYQQRNGAILKHEVEYKHLLTRENKFIDMKPFPIKKNNEKASYIILNFKIITSNHLNAYLYCSKYPDKTKITLAKASKISPKISSNRIETSVDMLTKEMMRLYQDQDFTDFQLNCGQNSIAVHKGILSARSPVFKNLLASDMKEASSGSMDIVDLDTPTLSSFLSFLYTGTVEDLHWDNALKLYYAADKYQVSTLKKECVSVLSADVSISNVCEILSLADKHHDDQLTSVAHDFIVMNYSQVLKSEEWMNFMKVDPELLLRTLTHLGQKDHVGKIKAS